MTKETLLPALERAGVFVASLDQSGVIDEESGFSVADLMAVIVAAEPVTLEDELNDLLGDVA